jgi:hypothetical protein
MKMSLSILLSIIIVLGGAQSPSGDFNDGTAISQPVATSTSSTTPVQQKKGSFDAK